MVDDGGMEALKDRFQVLVDRFQLDKDGGFARGKMCDPVSAARVESG